MLLDGNEVKPRVGAREETRRFHVGEDRQPGARGDPQLARPCVRQLQGGEPRP